MVGDDTVSDGLFLVGAVLSFVGFLGIAEHLSAWLLTTYGPIGLFVACAIVGLSLVMLGLSLSGPPPGSIEDPYP